MIAQKDFENIKKLLKKHNQSHLLAFWEQLNTAQRQNLLAQIRQLDFSKIDNWVADFVKKPTFAEISADFAPAQSYGPDPADAEQKRRYGKAVELGRELISAGKVTALVVAGGQATRLAFDSPKGNFPISPVKNKTLFQIFAETIAAVSEKYQTVCPWYIMASPLNYAETVEIFRSNDYYGLRESDVFIFQQGTLPNFSFDGKILLAKALIKAGPKEKIGNFCLVDGKVTVIEYSDFPDSQAEKRNPDGSLTFQLGSIAIHIINTGFVEKLNASGFSLPLHRAVKKIPHIDEKGERVEPAEPNGIKLESFVFDALPLASKSIILQTLRSQEFAPTKNLTGVDSVETTKLMMVARAADWLESAGVTVPRKPDGSIDAILEIAPSFALEKDDVKAKLNQIPEIKPKDKLYLA